jgi:hypothetical protein
MSNTRQYRYLHKGENEWLSDPPPADASEADKEAWVKEWEVINDEAKGLKVEFTEDMYCNSDHGEMPEWVNVRIHDSGVLPFKMARGVMGALDGVSGVVFRTHFDVDMSEEWGGWGYCRLEIGDTHGAYLTIKSKHSSEELELNITEQFNQAIGETA